MFLPNCVELRALSPGNVSHGRREDSFCSNSSYFNLVGPVINEHSINSLSAISKARISIRMSTGEKERAGEGGVRVVRRAGSMNLEAAACFLTGRKVRAPLPRPMVVVIPLRW